MNSLHLGPLTIDPPVMLAPMAGITSWPMRMMCRRMGAPLAFTEMVSAAAVSRGIYKADTLNSLKSHPFDRPLGLQLYGGRPEEFAAAAAAFSPLDADLIDINMGCPVRKIMKSGAGAALMRDLPLAAAIVKATRAATKLPLTVKMRLGWDDGMINAHELARICEGEGADAVIIHGRTRAQGFAGEASLAGIAEVVRAVKIPVIGNGGINTAADAKKMMDETGCAGVMIARGARGNPWLFKALAEGGDSPAVSPTIDERRAVVLDQLQLFLDFLPPRLVALEMRKHLAWHSRGLPRATDLRRSLSNVESMDQLRSLIEQYFRE